MLDVFAAAMFATAIFAALGGLFMIAAGTCGIGIVAMILDHVLAE